MGSCGNKNMNIKQPPIIIIIPCYNRRNYIREALESVAMQDYKNKRVVVVDDHSDDGTFEILTQLKNKWTFELLRTDRPKRGTYWISNMIMKRYPGEIYQNIDSDDILLPGKTAKLLEFMEKEHAEIVGGQFTLIDEKGKKTKKNTPWRPYNANYACKLKRNAYLHHSGMMWKRSVVSKIGYFNDSTICTSDYEYLLKAHENNIVIRNIPDEILKYRVHRDTLSNSYRFGIINEEREKNLKRIKAQYPPYYQIKFEYLDFFQKEKTLFAGPRREAIERWNLEYICQLVKEKKINDWDTVFSIVNKTAMCKYEKKDTLFLLELARGKYGEAGRHYSQARQSLPASWTYQVASVCKTFREWEYAQELFETLLKKRTLEREFRAGIHFHLGEIENEKGNRKSALKRFSRCLDLNTHHKKAREAFSLTIDN
ncbi:MAG: glycosyltransferase [bacterium]|nr:glycosyltransferase [bacterium]